ncbi:hypothetical protein HanIR_Chr04g0178301 [Helianthus annuus]|nr:hypothetical protein HanIR_Chr04g0178301 [Helianthus annuus]
MSSQYTFKTKKVGLLIKAGGLIGLDHPVNQKDEVLAAFMSFRVLASQSNPSYSPSPLSAQVPCICHFRFFSSNSPRPSHTSIGVIAPFCI